MARKAALAAKADALRAKMRESHLANFRMEAKRRCVPQLPQLSSARVCAGAAHCDARAASGQVQRAFTLVAVRGIWSG